VTKAQGPILRRLWSVGEDRNQLVDAGAALVLTILGLVGFRTAFAGSAYLVTGVCACAIGVVVALVALQLELPLWASVPGAVLLSVLLSGLLVAPGHALGGVLPTPSSAGSLFGGLVNGWARLLTSLPPSGGAGGVLAIPYLCGFAGTTVSLGLSARWPRLQLGVVPPLVVLALSILFGTEHPASPLLQGALFGAVALAWAAFRADRYRTVVVHRGRLFRVLTGVALLGVAGGGALALGPQLASADAHSRFLLRNEVQPPFYPESEPGPLVAFRNYVTGKGANQVLLVLKGLPAGATVRLATLDGYDGVVWLTTGSGGATAGDFDEPGALIPPGPPLPESPPGPRVDVSVDDVGLSGVWLPTVGDLRSVNFTGPSSAQLGETWRYNPATGSAAVPQGMAPGARYAMVAEVPSAPAPVVLRKLALVSSAVLSAPGDVPAAITNRALAIVRGISDPYDQAVKLQNWFLQGSYSDGGPSTDVPPGHSIGRLVDFLSTQRPVGDAEQYAAAMGLMARLLDMPVRVVVGFRPSVRPGQTVVLRGRDLGAWVEIDFQGAGWVPFYPTPPRTHTAKQVAVAAAQPKNTVSQPPPPTTVPPTDVPPQLSKAVTGRRAHNSSRPLSKSRHPRVADSVMTIVAASVVAALGLFLLLPALVVVGLKAGRRRRRRHRSTGASQVVGAWDEVLDGARDMGLRPPASATRKEAAALLPVADAGVLADLADTAIFGPDEPDRATAAAIWSKSMSMVRSMRAVLTRRQRVRAALSLASLRSGDARS